MTLFIWRKYIPSSLSVLERVSFAARALVSVRKDAGRCFQTQVDPHPMIYLSPAAETNIGNINIRDQHDRAFIGEQF